MRKFWMFLVALITVSILVFAGPAMAQEPAEVEETSTASETTAPAAKEFEYGFSGGSFDLMIAAGLGNFIYPHIEPGIEFGLLPLGNGLVIGVGGVMDMGWCLLCPFVGAFSELKVSSWYLNPMARATLHMGFIAELIRDRRFDPYVGIIAGPSFYSITLSVHDESANFSAVTMRAGGLAGLRYGMGPDRRWIVYGELRHMLEVGFDTMTVESSGGQTYTAGDNYASAGTDIVFGGGIRF